MHGRCGTYYSRPKTGDAKYVKEGEQKRADQGNAVMEGMHEQSTKLSNRDECHQAEWNNQGCIMHDMISCHEMSWGAGPVQGGGSEGL